MTANSTNPIRQHIATPEAVEAADQRFFAYAKAAAESGDLDKLLAAAEKVAEQRFVLAAARSLHKLEDADEREAALEQLADTYDVVVRQQGRKLTDIHDNEIVMLTSSVVADARKDLSRTRRARKQSKLAEAAKARLLAEGKTPCVTCGGVGRLEHFKHVEDGICFDCDGSGEQRQ